MVLFYKSQTWKCCHKPHFHSYKLQKLKVEMPLNTHVHMGTCACSATNHTCQCKKCMTKESAVLLTNLLSSSIREVVNT